MIKDIQHLPSYKNFSIDVLRLDLIHPFYGGNKYFKLKYNIQKVAGKTILTFGGAHSNHIYSTAAFCHEQKLKCVGVIRGEESMIENSPTLQFAKQQGMHLHFVSREIYRTKTEQELLNDLKKEFGDFYLIPEGGNNEEGIKGCMEILDEVLFYDYIFCACGTSCTYTGILASANLPAGKAGKDQKIIGISVLKGENQLIDEVNANTSKFNFEKIKAYSSGKIDHSTILNNYHFGGYAKHAQELLNFKNEFEKDNHIPLDYVYTSKLFYAVYDLINKELLLENKKILIVHSGGQQGNAGYERRYGIIT
ncbi:MAG: pyridoxal-phosphate dependent enzyme [Sphingobacteriaceae bacterium]|nr:pyridoxal-phosphate dependent enzyme [Sphingobacteriaceae bacterium]